jgi:outer membrane lipoprotein-sorting protein
MNRRWVVGLSILVMLSLFIGGCQSRPTAEEIVAKMQEVEASIDDAHAVVEFDAQAEGMDLDLVVEMWEKRPNKFRAEVLEASEDDLVGAVSVTDGQQVWLYHPGENEVVVGELGEMEGPTSPHEMIHLMEGMIQQVLDTCDVELVGEEDVTGVATYKLEFTPKEDGESVLPPGSKATLWVEQDRWIVLQAHLSGGILGEGWVRVHSFEFNAGVPDNVFQFEIPAGVQVTDIEDKQPQSLTLDEALAQAEFTMLVPAYLPEGATLIEVFSVDDAFVLRYDHSEVSFTIVQRSSSPAGEPPIGEEVAVRGQTATLITDEGLGKSFLAWTEGGVDITIAGQISQEEIVKVAESLQ